MPANRNVILPAIVVLSTLANFGLGFLLHDQSREHALLRDEAEDRRRERDSLLALIPELKPRISKGELLQVLRHSHPGEQANDVGDHVQWRLIQFWFDQQGALEIVRWSS